jgi:GH24 family phage-related lysozyme (muramidase)
MAKPTNDSGFFLDQLIVQMRIHLQSVGGIYITSGVIAPAPTPIPGFKTWTGYTISPGQRELQAPVQGIPTTTTDVGNYTYTVELETDPELNRIMNTTRAAIEGVRQSLDANGFGESVTTLTDVKNVEVKSKSNIKESTAQTKKIRKSGVPDISDIDPALDWVGMAMSYMITREKFTPKATNDEGDPRLGYGTSQIFVSNTGGKLVTRKVVYGDTTTQEHALIVLESQIKNTFKYKVVTNKPQTWAKINGNRDYTIRPADWDALKDSQKAACICFVYNCGSFLYHPNIAEALRNKNYEAAALGIENGPTRGAETGILYPGLVKRRKEEAMLFRLSK